MNTTWQAVMLLSLLSCLTTCMGVVLALVVRESSRAVAAGIGFAGAGLSALVYALLAAAIPGELGRPLP